MGKQKTKPMEYSINMQGHSAKNALRKRWSDMN